uniref:Uncharacterized protein n=1 Tax=Rhizophora mucronata TaxID=61149 RepID=A0A2P2N0A4_RHIMU
MDELFCKMEYGCSFLLLIGGNSQANYLLKHQYEIIVVITSLPACCPKTKCTICPWIIISSCNSIWQS